MKLTGGIVLGYGVVVMLGGLVGYLMADSLPSLFAGTTLGAALVAAGMGMIRNSRVAFLVSLGVTLLLTIFFALRYFSTEKFMPSGLMGIMSLAILVLLFTARGKLQIRKS